MHINEIVIKVKSDDYILFEDTFETFFDIDLVSMCKDFISVLKCFDYLKQVLSKEGVSND